MTLPPDLLEQLVAALADAKVGAEFGVSDTAVGKHARLRGWAERVAPVDRSAAAQVDERVARDRAQRVAASLELIDLVRSQLLDKARDGEAEIRIADLPALVKLEQLLLGEATERISFVEVQAWARQVLEVALRFVPAERRREFVAASLELLEGGERPAIEGRAIRRGEGEPS